METVSLVASYSLPPPLHRAHATALALHHLMPIRWPRSHLRHLRPSAWARRVEPGKTKWEGWVPAAVEEEEEDEEEPASPTPDDEGEEVPPPLSADSEPEEESRAEELAGLEEEAMAGRDEGRAPTDYDRRAHIFDESSRVFRALKNDGNKNSNSK